MATKRKAPQPATAEKQRHAITVDTIKDWASEAKAADRNRLFYDDHKNAPRGFCVRVTKAGTVAFVLSYYANGVEHRATVGRFPALSIPAARRKAAALRDRVTAGGDPLTEQRAARTAALKAKEEAKARDERTLAKLVAAYIAHMRDLGKASAREVETLFARSVAVPFPRIAEMALAEVTPEAVMPAFHRLAKAKKFRDAEKLASYLKSAFNAAKAARTKTSGHAFKDLGVHTNPLAELTTEREGKKDARTARDAKAEFHWTLTQPELATYWQRIEAMATSRGALLRLHLLTGGQRREQLVRLERADFDAANNVITLWDGKGRRNEAREHLLPLLPEARAAIDAMAGVDGVYLCSFTAGNEPVSAAQLDDVMGSVAAAMVAAGEIARAVTPGAIRRTVETLLGQAGVFKEIRAQLQSHGLHGVQDRHYDMGNYLPHKRDALEKLRALCNPRPHNVTPIRAHEQNLA